MYITKILACSCHNLLHSLSLSYFPEEKDSTKLSFSVICDNHHAWYKRLYFATRYLLPKNSDNSKCNLVEHIARKEEYDTMADMLSKDYNKKAYDSYESKNNLEVEIFDGNYVAKIYLESYGEGLGMDFKIIAHPIKKKNILSRMKQWWSFVFKLDHGREIFFDINENDAAAMLYLIKM